MEWFDLIYNGINYGEWYKISKDGNIYSIRRNILLKISINGNGYKVFAICINSYRVGIILSRALACTFIPNPENKTQVNHKDGEKMNNDLDNLEWVTNKENCQHACDNGLYKTDRKKIGMSGKKHTKKSIELMKSKKIKKITKKEIENIKNEYKNTNTTYLKLSKKYNVSTRTINKIILDRY